MSSKWPIEDQQSNPLARSRHVARMYMIALQRIDPVAKEEIDRLAEKYGEVWVRENIVMYDDSDQLSVNEAAEMLGVGPTSVYKYQKAGRLTGIRTRHGMRFSAKEVRLFKRLPPGRKRGDVLPGD